MSLLDRLVPASALSWGVLTSDAWECSYCGVPDWLNPVQDHANWLGHEWNAPRPWPDPAAAWGEADRRAEDR